MEEAHQLTVRRDIWTQENDDVLADIVLSHIRNGSTQLAAFDEAAEALNRTSAACGFRWNSEVRKQYEDEIKQAKRDKKELKSRKEKERLENVLKGVPDFSKVVADMKKQNDGLREIIEAKDREIEEWKRKFEEVASGEYVLSEDYKNFIEILKRARTLGVI